MHFLLLYINTQLRETIKLFFELFFFFSTSFIIEAIGKFHSKNEWQCIFFDFCPMKTIHTFMASMALIFLLK